jgi:hypothetical protein
MATAFLLPLSNLFASLQDLVACFLPLPDPVPRPVVRMPVQRAVPLRPAKPLRVVRVLEPSAPRAIAGRMVISGRLADVCAELDRLAALEAR